MEVRARGGGVCVCHRGRNLSSEGRAVTTYDDAAWGNAPGPFFRRFGTVKGSFRRGRMPSTAWLGRGSHLLATRAIASGWGRPPRRHKLAYRTQRYKPLTDGPAQAFSDNYIRTPQGELATHSSAIAQSRPSGRPTRM